MGEEVVVLVDDDDREIGLAPKESVHTTNTPLHRGFSCFLFNSKKELLLTKRASTKKTFPGVWTNTVCGHPAPGESVEEAALRRLNDELGLTRLNLVKKQGSTFLREITPYRYRFTDANGIVENEICPVLVGYCDTDPKPDKTEIEDWRWVRWEEFLEDIKKNPEIYSPWSREESYILAHSSSMFL
ncbi:MAG: isopentenyl-diphosphate Delta-isomerase [Patescibacteria group bacterium]